jgi:hypothetical protein
MKALNAAKELIIKVYSYLLSLIPRRLPVGITEFHAWADRIIARAGKIASEDSMKFVLATELIRLEKRVRSISDSFFVNTLHVAAAKQVGGAMFQEIKAKQAAQQTVTEVTAPTSGAENAKT